MPTSSLGCLTVFAEGVTGKRRYATAAIESLTFRTRERQKKKQQWKHWQPLTLTSFSFVSCAK